MPKPFLSLILSLCACLTPHLLTGCGTPFQQARLEPMSGQPVSVLNGLSLVTSRDVLVKLRAPGDLARISALVKAQSAEALSPQTQLYKLRIPMGQSLLASLETLSGQVVYAEPNTSFKLPDFQVQQAAFAPDDPDFDKQWNFKSSRIDQAWSLFRGDTKLTVAVIDSGVDPNHPDLADRLEPLEDVYKAENGGDFFQAPDGGFINYNGRDGNGHGTHVTGIIAAALDNGIGVSGVAEVRILPIKATNYAGETHAATLVSAFQVAIDRGADIVNISIGGPQAKGTQALADVIQLALKRGISVIAATGNDSTRIRGVITPIALPAAYDGVIAVGAHTEFDRVADYSNGGTQIDLLAPGGGGNSLGQREGRKIWSSWPTYTTYAVYQKAVSGTSYAATSGTSMAAPHVTGVVALMLAREPHLTPAQIRARLIATADSLGDRHFNPDSGYGKLNAYRALNWNTDDAHD